MTEADAEDLDPVFRYIEATKGSDMSAMRQMATALAELEVGVDTPAPRSRLPVALPDPTGLILPPLYEGENEAPNGKFTDLLWLPESHTSSFVGQRQYTRLWKRMRRVIWWLTLLWMSSLTFAFVVIYRW